MHHSHCVWICRWAIIQYAHTPTHPHTTYIFCIQTLLAYRILHLVNFQLQWFKEPCLVFDVVPKPARIDTNNPGLQWSSHVLPITLHSVTRGCHPNFQIANCQIARSSSIGYIFVVPGYLLLARVYAHYLLKHVYCWSIEWLVWYQQSITGWGSQIGT